MLTKRLNKLFGFKLRERENHSKSKQGEKRSLQQHDAGFTLIEVLIAMAVIGIVLGGIYAAYSGQVRTFNTQEQIVDMQQNIRVANYFLERELRMAGLDPSGNAGAGFVVAAADTINFTMDFTGGAGDTIDNDGNDGADEGQDTVDNDGDGFTDEPDEAEWYNASVADANEDISYRLSNDADGDGINDGLPTENNDGSACNLERRSSANGPWQVVAANIDALNFAYLGVDPTNNACGENCQWDPANDDPRDIRTVQITIVARAGATVRTFSRQFTNNTTYYNQPPFNQIILPPQNDNFRRFRLMTSVRCRNMGL